MELKIKELIKEEEKFDPFWGNYIKREILHSIPYYIYKVVINGSVFRKNFVVDLTKFNSGELEKFFRYFDAFNSEMGGTYNYNTDDKYRWNNNLIMVYDDRIKDFINNYKYKVIENYDYFLKKFITVDVFNKMKDSVISLKRESMFLNNKSFYKNGLNLIYGCNGSGKTLLLKELEKNLNLKIFNLDSKNNYDIENTYEFNNYYELLTSNYYKGKLTSIDNIYYMLSVGLAYGDINNCMVLFDDMCWGGIDSQNIINIVDNLNNYSYSNGVVVTACQSHIKQLIKRRVYEPNIIDL